MTLLLPHGRSRAEVVDELRHLLPRMQAIPAQTRTFSFGLSAIDACLPQDGLCLDAVHEITSQTPADEPAAFGFVTALLGRLPRGGPVIFITSRKDGFANGRLHGHGLNNLGLDPARVVFVDTKDNKDALWATEEALRSGVPCAVAAGIGAKLDLLAGQRLHLAAGDCGIPLFLLRPPDAPGANVATTRWRVSAKPAGRDRFGLITQWRWRVRLERCRNGRLGEWLLEFDHGAYRFGLSAAMANPAISRRASA